MITSRQVRAARALLGWTQEMLADKALVALTALKRLESDPLKVREETRHQSTTPSEPLAFPSCLATAKKV